jgi:hypothetical protein
VSNGDIVRWLFIDDGAGNVVAPDGVMYRKDIIDRRILGFAWHIPDYCTAYHGPTEQYVFSSKDHKYAYPGCSETVTSNRIYTDDCVSQNNMS